MPKQFHWEGDLTTNLRTMDFNIKKGVVAAANYTATAANSYMKQNAPWTDRTGAARSGLGSKVEINATSVAIVLYHSVEYGVYLEVNNGGRYAIIQPTMEAMIPILGAALARLVFKEIVA